MGKREQGLVRGGFQQLKVGFAALAIFVSCPAWGYSAWLESYVNQLRPAAINYQSQGAICEQVARLEFEQKYPRAQYKVDVNMAYGVDHQTLGELDLVVSDRFSDAVILVGEVKCWTEPGRAQNKGAAQRTRFLEHLDATHGLWVKHDFRYVKVSRFHGLRDFILIGPRGSRSHGFEYELRLDLEDLMALREAMMECQKAGECARP